MNRPLLFYTVAFIIGIIEAQLCKSYLLIILTGFIILAGFIFVFRAHPGRLYILGIALFYMVGALEFIYIDNANTSRFDEYSEQQVTIKGFVDSEGDVRETKVNYIIRTKEIVSGNSASKAEGKILLSTLKSARGTVYQYGSPIEIRGILNIAKARTNPGGFDYKAFLAKSGISATIFAVKDDIKADLPKSANPVIKAGLFLRSRIIYVINRSLPEEEAGLLNGMLIGYREGLSKEVQTAFSDAGLTHIMAVSGANIAFIVLPLVFVFKKIRVRQRLANIIIIAILGLFVIITGFSPSVLRAVIMAVIILTGQIIRREADTATSISFAALILLVCNPYALYDIGFQLSFAATISIVMLHKSIKNFIKGKIDVLPNWVLDTLTVTIAAQIGVLPITALYFNKISVVSIFSNMLVVPMTGLVTILGCIMAVLGQFSIVLSQMLGYFNNYLLAFILFISKTTAAWSFAAIRVITPPLLLVAAYYIIIGFFFWYKPKKKITINRKYYVYTAVAAFIIIFINIIAGLIIPKNMEVVFIDVGEGDSAFIRTSSGKTVLIDGGGYNSKIKTESNIGERVIIPFLLDYGVTSLDMVIASHPHDDHIQGLIPVFANMKVENLVIPEGYKSGEFKELLDASRQNNSSINLCKKGDRIWIDDRTCFDVLYPRKSGDDYKSSLNNGSLVLKLQYKRVSILFSGDIEKDVENLLMGEKADLKADVLKVAHHGSANSTNSDFLSKVSPKAAVISVGKNNFGHPSENVINRLFDSKVQLFRTDRDGAVILSTNGEKISFERTARVE